MGTLGGFPSHVAQEAGASGLVCGAGAGLGVEVKPLVLHHQVADDFGAAARRPGAQVP